MGSGLSISAERMRTAVRFEAIFWKIPDGLGHGSSDQLRLPAGGRDEEVILRFWGRSPGGNDGSDDADADAFLEFIEPVLEAGECLQTVGAAVGEVGTGTVSLDETQFPQIQAGSQSAL